MAGINLSQSIKEKQALAQGNLFDRSFFINVAVFLVVLGLYGGSQWYLSSIETRLTTLRAESMAKEASMKNADADSIADFHARLATIETNLESNPDPKAAFDELEQKTLPPIRVTRYEWQQLERELHIFGVTTSLKFLAQQMLNYKKISGIASVTVQGVKYNDAGEIEFELRLPLQVASAENAS